MSVMRKEQWLGRYSSGDASGHHHVGWVLNGHHDPGGSHTLGPSRKEKSRSCPSRHTASTSGDRSASPCWIGATTGVARVAGSWLRVPDALICSKGKPRGQMRSSL